MKLTKLAINRPVTTAMFTLALIFLGLISWSRLPVQRLPDITFPSMYYTVRVQEEELSPERTNDLITRPVEKLVASLPGLKETYSHTGAGWFWGYAKFESAADMQYRVIELQDKISEWRAGQSMKLTSRVVPFSTGDDSGDLMRLILSVPVGQDFRTASVSSDIRRKLKSIDGVSEVDIAGEVHPNVVLETERDQVMSAGMEVQQLVDAVNSASRDRKWLGSFPEADKNHGVYLETGVDSLEELLKVPVDEKGVFPLSSLVETDRDIEPPDTIFRFNGKKAVSINISRERDKNALKLARQVRMRLDDIRKDLPPGFDLTIVHDEAADLEKLIRDVAKLALLGAFLAMLVMLFFVRNLRIALVVVVAVPASIFITFNALYIMNLSINILSLLGLAAAVGMLVDNSIVVVENVFRHFRKNPDAKAAAHTGADEVVRAVLIATATNLVVFAPLFFIDENMSLVMRDMALSLVFPMVVSLFIAMTLVPMLTSRVVMKTSRKKILDQANPRKKPPRKQYFKNAVQRIPVLKSVFAPGRNRFREIVFFFTKASLRHPIRLFVIIILIFLFTFISAHVKIAIQRFQQQPRTHSIKLYGKAHLGSELDETDDMFQEKETQVAEVVEKSEVFNRFTSRFDAGGGEIRLSVADDYKYEYPARFHAAYADLSSGDISSGFRFQPFPRAAEVFQPTSMMGMGAYAGGGSHNPESIVVTGENMDAMQDAGKALEEFLKERESVTGTNIDTPKGQPEIHFHPDTDLFKIMQADPSSIYLFFQARGDKGISTSFQLKEENDVERIITLKVEPSETEKVEEETLQTLAELKKTKVALLNGGQVPLDNLGEFSVTFGTPTIRKKDRRRELKVGFRLEDKMYKRGFEKERQNILADIQKDMKDVRLPTGISAHMGGMLEETRQSRVTWKKLLLLAIVGVFLVMAFFFDSLILPFIILVTLPLAFVGGVWGIIMFKTTLDEVAMLGSIILAGLAVNNGILLLEFTRRAITQQGFRRSRALMSAVSYRLRPILMTSLTTILGLAPIVLSKEAEREARSLVSVIIGGMTVSAILTLVVVPSFYNVLYTGIDKLQSLKLRQRLLARLKRLLPGKKRIEVPPVIIPAPAPLEMKDLSIKVKNVSKIYSGFSLKKIKNVIPSSDYPLGGRPPEGTEALRHVTLDIEQGMFGLLGPNGAGKTTLMKILTGIINPTYGIAEIGGNDVTKNPWEMRKFISYLPQNFGVYGVLNLEQYLNFLASYSGFEDRQTRRKKIDEVIEFVGLSGVRKKPMKRFSGGMRQRAGIAQFLLDPAPVLIVDEPTAGLDPVERVRFRILLSGLARERIVILSTHIVEDITSSCKRIGILNQGRLVYEGEVKGIQTAANGLVWDLEHPPDQTPKINPERILYRRHQGEKVLYHYVSEAPLPGSVQVPPTFEDAYMSLLLKHGVVGV